MHSNKNKIYKKKKEAKASFKNLLFEIKINFSQT